MLQDDPRCSQSLLRDCLRILDGRRRLRVPIVAHRNSSRIWIWFFEDSLRSCQGFETNQLLIRLWLIVGNLEHSLDIPFSLLLLLPPSIRLLRFVGRRNLAALFADFLSLSPSLPFSLSLSLSLSVTISVSLWLFRLNAAYLMKTSSD